MNKGILTFVFALCLSLSTTQNVLAKEKKVTYMGHTYKGEVDNNKVPAGSGWIGIGKYWTDEGFTLFGDFKENNVENGSIEKEYVKLAGTFVFDESDCVTLKKGGTITYKIVSVIYGNWQNTKVGEREESKTIPSDLKVDINYFNDLKECEVSYAIVPEDIPSILNPPTLIGKLKLSLGKYKYQNNNNGPYYDANAFLESSDKDKNHSNVYDYEDGEGRKWSYTVNKDYINSSSPVYDYTVTYPDGSYYSHKAEKYSADRWKINYPNGDVFESTTNGEWIITLKNGIQICTGGPKSAGEFVKYNNSKTYPTFSDAHDKVIIPTSLTDGLNSSQIANLIKEQILSVVPLKRETNMISHVTRFENDRFREDETIIGTYREGKYESKKEKISKDNAATAAQEKKNREYLIKTYGKTYYDAICQGKLLVGMPIGLCIDSRIPWATVYKMHYYNDGESGDVKIVIYVTRKNIANGWGGTLESGVYTRTFRAWLKNHKITKFRDWNNMDQLEFNGL